MLLTIEKSIQAAFFSEYIYSPKTPNRTLKSLEEAISAF